MNDEKTSIETSPIPDSKPVPKKSLLKEIIKEGIIFALVIFAIFYVVRPYIAEPYLVDGRSMDPTFATGDYLIVDKLSHRLEAPARKSVMVLKYPNDPSKSFIKRVIGLPGETISMKNNVVTITNAENPEGFQIDEPYVINACVPQKYNCIDSFEKTLSGDEYFVMGDNRAESFDSRSWGPLEKSYIQGRPFLRLFPLSKISIWPGASKQ